MKESFYPTTSIQWFALATGDQLLDVRFLHSFFYSHLKNFLMLLFSLYLIDKIYQNIQIYAQYTKNIFPIMQYAKILTKYTKRKH